MLAVLEGTLPAGASYARAFAELRTTQSPPVEFAMAVDSRDQATGRERLEDMPPVRGFQDGNDWTSRTFATA